MRAVQRIIADAGWRRALIDLSEREASLGREDPFLEFVVNAVAESPHKRDVAGSAILAADVGFAQQLVEEMTLRVVRSDAAADAGGAGGSAAASGGASAAPAVSVGEAVAPLMSTELPALLGSAVLHALVSRITAGGEAGPGAGPGAGAGAGAGAGREAGSPVVVRAALRASRAREELGYGMLLGLGGGALSSALSALPGDPFALYVAALAAAADAGGGTAAVQPTSSVYEAALRLRRITLRFFGPRGGRDEFFAEEGQARLHSDGSAATAGGGKGGGIDVAALLSGVGGSSGAGSASSTASGAGNHNTHGGGGSNGGGGSGGVEGKAAGEDFVAAETEERAVRAVCARPLSAGDVATLATCVTALREVMYDGATVSAVEARRDE